MEGKSRAEVWTALCRACGIPERVSPWPYLAPLYYEWASCGRDANGVTLSTERKEGLRSIGWTEPGEWDAGLYLMAVLEGENAAIFEELHPAPKGK